MSTYKVIQDIEAEDKLVGPLSLRQFLYAIGATVGGYLCFLCVNKGAAFLLVVFAPITAGVAFFAVPWRKEQSTEVWALAHLRYYVMPRKRIWNQSGVREYVRIIAKPPVRKVYSNGMSPDEVQSRLKALATTIDTRGWAVKGATSSDLSQIDPLLDPTMSDRLVGPTIMPEDKVNPLKIKDDMAAHEDILDDANSVSRNLSGMIDRQTEERHRKLSQQVQAAARAPQVMSPTVSTAYGSRLTPNQPAGQWFVNAPGGAAPTVITPGAASQRAAAPAANDDVDEKALAAQFKSQQEHVQKAYYGHLKVLQPLGKQGNATKTDVTKPSAPVVDKAVTAPRAKMAAPTTVRPAAPQTTAKSAASKIAAHAATAAKPTPAAAAHPVKPVAKAPVTAAPVPSASEMTSQPDPAILELASNDDLDIATIARQINKHKSPNEVEIRLH